MTNANLDTLLKNFCLEHKLDETTPGISILIQQNNATLFSFNTGVRDTNFRPITSKSNFRLASISKQFTAACILQLIHQGRLTFDTAITDIFPDFPAHGRCVTLYHLLIHASGIEDYEDSLSLIPKDQLSDQDVYFIAQSQNRTMFPPGSQYHYSNGGYCILALIVAKLSGLSFDEYLQKHLFIPSKMGGSRLNSAVQIQDRVYGFSQNAEGKWLPNDQDKTSATQGDGGIYASSESLIAWHKHIYKADTILTKEHREWMTTPHITADQADEGYGGGLYISRINGRLCYRHGGSSIGFSNALFYLPEQDISFCILSNLNGIDMTDMGKKLLSCLHF